MPYTQYVFYEIRYESQQMHGWIRFPYRNQPAKRKTRPDIVHSTQPNPNSSFATNGGFENKGVDTVKDNGNHDDSDPMIKNNIYSVQNGYQYNGAHTYPEQVSAKLRSNSSCGTGGSSGC